MSKIAHLTAHPVPSTFPLHFSFYTLPISILTIYYMVMNIKWIIISLIKTVTYVMNSNSIDHRAWAWVFRGDPDRNTIS